MEHPLQREIDAFDLKAPERDAQRNIAAGDQRFLAVWGYGPMFPGIPNEHWLSVVEKKDFRRIEGTSDVVAIGHHAKLMEMAQHYAERYNRHLWARRSKDLTNR